MQNVTNTFKKICKNYGSNLEDLISPIIEHWQSPVRSYISIIWLSVLTIIMIVYVALTTWPWILYKAKRIHKIGILAESESPEEDSSKNLFLRNITQSSPLVITNFKKTDTSL